MFFVGKVQGNRGEGSSSEDAFLKSPPISFGGHLSSCTFRRPLSPRSTQWVLGLA